MLGVLYVDNVAAPVPYEHTDLLILTHIGHLAAVKILDGRDKHRGGDPFRVGINPDCIRVVPDPEHRIGRLAE